MRSCPSFRSGKGMRKARLASALAHTGFTQTDFNYHLKEKSF